MDLPTQGIGIVGRAPCIAAWCDTLLRLPDDAPREVWCIDPDFADWPFDDAAVLQALLRWAQQPGRTIRFVAIDYDAVARRFPRLTAWRRDWSHVVQAFSPAEGERLELPSVLHVGARAIEVLERDRWRARSLAEPAALRQLAEACDAIAQRCEPAWPATTLGL